MTETYVLDLLRAAHSRANSIADLNGLKILLADLVDVPSFEATFVMKVVLHHQYVSEKVIGDEPLKTFMATDEWKRFSEEHRNYVLGELKDFDGNEVIKKILKIDGKVDGGCS